MRPSDSVVALARCTLRTLKWAEARGPGRMVADDLDECLGDLPDLETILKAAQRRDAHGSDFGTRQRQPALQGVDGRLERVVADQARAVFRDLAPDVHLVADQDR